MFPLGRGGRREGIPYSSTRSTAPRTRLPLRDLLIFCPHYCVVTYSRAKLPECSTTIICWQYFIPIFCRNKLTRSKAVRSRRIIFQYAQWGYLLMDLDVLDYRSIRKRIWKWWLPTIVSPNDVVMRTLCRLTVGPWQRLRSETTFLRLCTSRSSTRLGP